jgi:hypothetical protein
MCVALLGSVAAAGSRLYVKRDSLQQTMLAARTQLQRWETTQRDSRQYVQAGAWFHVKLADGQDFDP